MKPDKWSHEVRPIINKIMEYAHILMHPEQSENNVTKIKYSLLTWQTKEIKNYIYKLRTKLT